MYVDLDEKDKGEAFKPTIEMLEKSFSNFIPANGVTFLSE